MSYKINLFWYWTERVLIWLLTILALFTLFFITTINKDYLNDHAEDFLNKTGFEIVVDEGWTAHWTWIFDTRYGGCKKWYLIKNDNSGLLYECNIQRWGNEIHLTHIDCMNGQVIQANGNATIRLNE